MDEVVIRRLMEQLRASRPELSESELREFAVAVLRISEDMRLVDIPEELMERVREMRRTRQGG